MLSSTFLGSIRVPASVEPDLLYSHLVSHCDKFHAKTLALQGVGGRGDVQSSAREIGLLIDVSKQSLGPTTSPEFSRLMEETEVSPFPDCFSVVHNSIVCRPITPSRF